MQSIAPPEKLQVNTCVVPAVKSGIFRFVSSDVSPVRWYHDTYLQSDHWKKLRRRVLVFARFRCQVCNGPDHVEVHHRTYERFPYREHPADVVALCAACHGLFHGRMLSLPERGVW